jgi:hypothetical protein
VAGASECSSSAWSRSNELPLPSPAIAPEGPPFGAPEAALFGPLFGSEQPVKITAEATTAIVKTFTLFMTL